MEPLWQSSGLTLYHTDCLRWLHKRQLSASVIVADPPYGETSLDWDKQVTGWPKLLYEACPESCSLWCFGSLRSFMSLGLALFSPWKLAQDLVWQKQNGSSFHADRFRRIHENVIHLYKGPWGSLYRKPVTTPDATPKVVRRKKRPTHMGHIEAGHYHSLDGGPRLMRSIIPVANCHGYAIHPTEKPVDLLRILLEYSCPVNGSVVDIFAGSGSTLEAAWGLGLSATGVEVNFDYCLGAIERLDKITKAPAARAAVEA